MWSKPKSLISHTGALLIELFAKKYFVKGGAVDLSPVSSKWFAGPNTLFDVIQVGRFPRRYEMGGASFAYRMYRLGFGQLTLC